MDNKWLALAGSFIVSNLTLGFVRSMNVLYVKLRETFSMTRAEAAMVQSSVMGVFGLSGFIIGPFINWLGAIKSGFIGTLMTSLALVLTYFVNHIILLTVILAVGTGIGCSTISIVALLLVGEYFDGKSKAMAISFVIFGSGISGVWQPYLITYLVDEYGLRGALLIFGGIQANCLVAFAAIVSLDKQLKPGKHLRVEKGKIVSQNQIVQSENEDGCVPFEDESKKYCSKNTDQQKKKTHSIYVIVSLLNNVPFILLVFGFGSAVTATNSILVIMMDHIEMLGYQRSASVIMITVINAINTVSGLLPGILKQICKMNLILLSVFCIFIGGVSAICLPFTTDFSVTAFLLSVIVGLCQGSVFSMRPLCIMNVIGDDQFSPAIGIATTVVGAGVILSGPITGLIKDTWGSYDVAFFLCGGTMLTSSAILAITFICTKKF